MQYLIDGHNLIPKIPGLSLADLDDEEKLIARLSEWARISRHKLTVFFDRAPQGKSGTRRISGVTAIFVPEGRTADAAIMNALARLKNAAKNVTVVSSDRMVLAAARASHAKVMKSETFAAGLRDNLAVSKVDPHSSAMTPEEIAKWEAIFSSKRE